jgi:hypothetical protein
MSPTKHYFKEPIVSVDLSKVRFPKICPVCGSRATTISGITIVSGPALTWHVDSGYLCGYGVRRKHDNQQLPLKLLAIQVCDAHHYTGEGEDRYKSLCFIVDGLALVSMLIGLMFLSDAITRGRGISPWVPIIITIFAMSMVLTAIAFRSNALARAVKIVGFDAGMQNILLAFKLNSYRDEFIKENSMHSELVRWILKAD